MGKKNLTDLLAEYAVNPKTRKASGNYAVFLAYAEQIEEAFKAGWQYIDIWRALRDAGVVEFSYPSFMHYLKKHERRRLYAVRKDEALANSNAATKPSPSATGPTPKEKPALPSPSAAPPIGKVDMPVFGQNRKPRDPDRF